MFSASLIFILKTAVIAKLLVSGILFSTYPISVLGAVVVTEQPLTSCIFLITSPILFSAFSLSVFY